MLKSPLCDLLGIEKPVFQGGMAWIADASLASAVSEAGGLGIIAAMNADAGTVITQAAAMRITCERLTSSRLCSFFSPLRSPLETGPGVASVLARAFRSRSIAPPISPISVNSGTSASPRLPPVIMPPIQARIRPMMMATADPCSRPAVSRSDS